MKENRKTNLASVTLFVLIILLVCGTSAAFWRVAKSNDQSTVIATSSDLHITFTDGDTVEAIGITPGATIIKTFSVENTGLGIAKYDILFNDVINELNNPGDLVYTLTSTNGGGTITERVVPTARGKILEGIEIPENTTQEYTITITYLLTNSRQNIDLNKNISFTIQILDQHGIKDPVCRRATNLHTGTCQIDSSNPVLSSFGCAGSGYDYGEVFTYGNLGTSGKLEFGDAFDCDINNDGIYDPNTERFYYLNTRNNIATFSDAQFVPDEQTEEEAFLSRFTNPKLITREYINAITPSDKETTCVYNEEKAYLTEQFAEENNIDLDSENLTMEEIELIIFYEYQNGILECEPANFTKVPIETPGLLFRTQELEDFPFITKYDINPIVTISLLSENYEYVLSSKYLQILKKYPFLFENMSAYTNISSDNIVLGKSMIGLYPIYMTTYLNLEMMESTTLDGIHIDYDDSYTIHAVIDVNLSNISY